MITVGNIYDVLNKNAPFKNQDKTDNSGLLIGDFNAEIRKILVCLDVTNDVAAEAISEKADLIISHHPLMYRPISKIMGNDPIHALVRGNISLIAAHTNLDVAFGGLPAMMLERLSFPPSETIIMPFNPDGTGYGRIAELGAAVFAKELAERCKKAFSCTVVRFVDSGKPLKKIGVSSGGGGEIAEAAFYAGCDALVCGEVRHDKMVFAANMGLTVIEAGHFHTEDIFCEPIRDRLRAEFPEIIIEKSKYSKDLCSYVT
jgi:dinuclear metal center YbgI/SA1388 family protein